SDSSNGHVGKCSTELNCQSNSSDCRADSAQRSILQLCPSTHVRTQRYGADRRSDLRGSMGSGDMERGLRRH
ncbi:MAG: hypothetical protein ACKO2L_21940, partial [Planctomycetaceae bacterium]